MKLARIYFGFASGHAFYTRRLRWLNLSIQWTEFNKSNGGSKRSVPKPLGVLKISYQLCCFYKGTMCPTGSQRLFLCLVSPRTHAFCTQCGHESGSYTQLSVTVPLCNRYRATSCAHPNMHKSARHRIVGRGCGATKFSCLATQCAHARNSEPRVTPDCTLVYSCCGSLSVCLLWYSMNITSPTNPSGRIQFLELNQSTLLSYFLFVDFFSKTASKI